jgi:hypothetical protein
MIDFKFDRSHYFDFTFWAIPLSRWEEFIPQYVAFCRDYQRETGFRCSLGSDVYFINRDQHAARVLEALFEATEDALGAVSAQDARGYFRHCGYTIPQAHSI